MAAFLALTAAVDTAGAIPWADVFALLLLAGIAGIAWQIHARMRGLEERLAELDRLREIRGELARLTEDRPALDLRRLEHVLIDLRDAQKRLDERLMQVLESARAERAEGAEPGPLAAPSRARPAALSERVVNRLLALGYERIQIVTPLEELAAVFEEGGEILVEARQQGAVCKGRVQVQGGGIVAAELRSAHSMFP